MVLAKPPPPLLPSFAEDIAYIPYKAEFDQARLVNAMIEAARDVQENGPRRHYKPGTPPTPAPALAPVPAPAPARPFFPAAQGKSAL